MYYCLQSTRKVVRKTFAKRDAVVRSTSKRCGTRPSSSVSSSKKIRGTMPRNGEGVSIGHYAELDRIFTISEVNLFGNVVDDKNPLHSQLTRDSVPEFLEEHPLLKWDDEGTERRTVPLVHGMLASSLFTSIFGTLMPGAIYVSQDLEFRMPIYCGESVTGRVELVEYRAFRRGGLILSCETTVRKNHEVRENEAIRGKARVWVKGAFATN